MSQSKEFFRELQNFLPVHVSAFPSYLHAFLVFVVATLIGAWIVRRYEPDEDSSLDPRLQQYALYGTSVLAGLFLADIAYSVSWLLRNRVNRKHITYKRWLTS